MDSLYDLLGEQIAEDAAHIDAAQHRILAKLRAFDASGRWHTQGFRSCAAWLSWRVGWTPNTAREHVRVANALAKLPIIDRALERGELSYCKVRALTRVATPQNEATLCEQAQLATGHQLEMICRKYSTVNRHDAEATRPEDDSVRRYIKRRETADGMIILEAALHPDEAAIVWAALERVAAERCRAASRPSDSSETVSAETPAPNHSGETIDRGDSETVSAETPAPLLDTPSPTGGSRRSRPAFDRADALVQIAREVVHGNRPERSPSELVISIPVEALEDAAHADPSAAACCSDGTVLSSRAARRLACDAGLVAMVEDDRGNILAAGRKKRTIPASTKRAMLKRDRTCRFPGCCARVFLQGHHLEHWADGGETKLSNLLSLCDYHHRFVHEYGFTIELRDDNTVVAFDSDGFAVPERAPTPQPSDLGWPNITQRNAHLGITPDSIECSDGVRISYDLCIHAIVRSDEHPTA